jgi:hypothetical protein
MHLDVFKEDPEFKAHEEEYAAIKREILGDVSRASWGLPGVFRPCWCSRWAGAQCNEMGWAGSAAAAAGVPLSVLVPCACEIDGGTAHPGSDAEA